MKYAHWDEYPPEKKRLAVNEELRLNTHNATTRDDLLNIMYFLSSEVETLKAQVAFKEEALDALLSSPVVDDDPRLKYVEMEVYREDLQTARDAFTAGYEQGKRMAEDARVGRAFVSLAQETRRSLDEREPGAPGIAFYIGDLEKVISEAKAGDPR